MIKNKKVEPDLIKFVRKMLNMNISEAARSIGVSISTWSMWESGSRTMRLPLFHLFLIINKINPKDVIYLYNRG